MNYKALATKLVTGAFEGGGITIDLEGNESVREAFIVGGAAPELNVPVQGSKLGQAIEDVARWLESLAGRLPGHVLGSWEYRGKFHFDVVTVIASEQDNEAIEQVAHTLGRARGEMYFGYLSTDQKFSEYGVYYTADK